jgi:molybdate ABC transporter permease protein
MNFDLSPLWISLRVAAVATLLTFALGVTIAYRTFGYRGRWKPLLDGLCISPLILPPTVVGFLLLQLFGKQGPLGQVLSWFEIDIVFTWIAAAIAATVISFPLMYRTALGAFEQIDGNLLRAARTLGASETHLFWRISLPLALPGILAGATLAFARGLGEFGATLMLAGNIPGVTETIPLVIYAAVEAGDTQRAWFWSIIILSITLSTIALVNLWVMGRQKGAEGYRQMVPIANTHRSASISPHPSPTLLDQYQPALVVDLYKKLPEFNLHITFSSDQDPLGILGASGAGKSVLLGCLAGTETPDRGRIVLNGRILYDSELGINLPSRDRRIGFIFQHYVLFPHLTVAQNIAFGMPKKRSARQVQQQVKAHLDTIQLSQYGDRFPHQLSGGQQQRVALARALASQPELLLLDEPFSALDTHLRARIERELLSILASYVGTTLLVTHNMEEAYRICENLLVLEQGKANAWGTKQQIFERPPTVSVAKLTGCKNFSRAVALESQQIEAIDWGCTLTYIEPLPTALSHVGIRAHQLRFNEAAQGENVFPCWIVSTSETPHRITLYLKLNTPPESPTDYHLQAELFKEKWITLKENPHPWQVQLDANRLLPLED